MNESFGCVERRPRWRKTALRVPAPVHRGRIVTFRERRARLSTDLSIRARNASPTKSASGADRYRQLISARCGLANLALQLRAQLPGFALNRRLMQTSKRGKWADPHDSDVTSMLRIRALSRHPRGLNVLRAPLPERRT
jgi:hypothetical protein